MVRHLVDLDVQNYVYYGLAISLHMNSKLQLLL
jgi:hypothetical protein